MNSIHEPKFIIRHNHASEHAYDEEGNPAVKKRGHAILSGKQKTRLGFTGSKHSSINVAIEVIHNSFNLIQAIIIELKIFIRKNLFKSVVELKITNKKGKQCRVLANINSIVHRLHLTKTEIKAAVQTNTLESLLMKSMLKERAIENSYKRTYKTAENIKKDKPNDAGLTINQLDAKLIMQIVRVAGSKLENRESTCFNLPGQNHLPSLQIAAFKEKNHFKIYILKPVQQVLGAGNFGTVSRVFEAIKGKMWAFKEAQPNAEAIRNLEQEYEVLQRLNPHGNRRGIQIAPHKIVLINDQATKGFLGEIYDQSYSSVISEERTFLDRLDECHQLLSGLEYLHAQGLVHGDLKPGNILTKKRTGQRRLVHIADFGGARFINSSQDRIYVHSRKYIPLIEWRELEAFDEKFRRCRMMDRDTTSLRREVDEREQQADVFAMGCVLFKAFTNDHPYDQLDDLSDQSIKSFPSSCPLELQSLIRRMLNPNRLSRPTARECVALLNEYLHQYHLDLYREIHPPSPREISF